MKIGVYILNIPNQKNTYKIGCSANIKARLNSGDYRTTFLPGNMPELQYILYFEGCKTLTSIKFFENMIHNILKKNRITDSRELFKIKKLRKEILAIMKTLKLVNIKCTLHTTLDDVPTTDVNINMNAVVKQDLQYGYQIPIVRKLLSHYNTSTNTRGKLVCPPGYGKTYISCTYLKESKYKVSVILCPQIMICDEFEECCNQLFKKGKANIITINSHNDNIIKIKKRKINIIISTYRSWHIIEQGLKKANTTLDLLIVDEAHHMCSGGANSSLLNIASTKKLFLTATPKTVFYKDSEDEETTVYSMENEDLFGKTIHQVDLSDAISHNRLCDYKLLAMEKKKYNPITLCHEMITKYNRKKIVLFFNTNAKSHNVSNDLMNSDIIDADIYFISHKNTKQQRDSIKHDFSTKSGVQILCNVNTISEGVSINKIDCILFIDPRFSPISLFQNIGRGLRYDVDKDICIIVLPNENKNDAIKIFQSLYQYDRRMTSSTKRQSLLIGGKRLVKKYDKQIHLIELERHGKIWMHKYNATLQYEKTDGIIEPNILYDEINLYKWLAFYIKKYNKNKLTAEKIYLLNNLNSFKYYTNPWDTSFNLCTAFEKTTSSNITDPTTHKNIDINYWLEEQVENYTRLTKSKQTQLTTLNSFKEKTWFSTCEKVHIYETHTNKVVTSSTTYDDTNIGQWFFSQCDNYNNLSEDQISTLKKLSSYSHNDPEWTSYYNKCVEYEVDYIIITEYGIYNDTNLYDWLKQNIDKFDKLSANKQNKLTKLNSYKTFSWFSMHNNCVKYEEKNKIIKYNSKYKRNLIGRWFFENFDNSSLSDDQITTFQTLDSYDYYNDTWFKLHNIFKIYISLYDYDDHISFCYVDVYGWYEDNKKMIKHLPSKNKMLMKKLIKEVG